jgi:hypothetical protein
MDNTTRSIGRKIDTHGARRLIFTLAVTSTLGFWVVASKASQFSTALVKGSPQSAGAVPPLQTENQLVLDLPPLPTLVSALESSTALVSQGPAAVQNPVTVVKPSMPITGKIFMGGAKPSASAGSVASTSSGGTMTITSTGSSK